MRRKNSPGCPCCGGDSCYVSCGNLKIPATDLTVVTTFVDSGSGFTSTLPYTLSDTGIPSWGSVGMGITCDSNRAIFHSGTVGVICNLPVQVISANPFHGQVKNFISPFPAICQGSRTIWDIYGPDWWPEPGVGGCVSCYPCQTCGGRFGVKSGSIHDDNGTHELKPWSEVSEHLGVQPNSGLYSEPISWIAPSGFYFNYPFGNCNFSGWTCVSTPVPIRYQYMVQCWSETELRVGVWINKIYNVCAAGGTYRIVSPDHPECESPDYNLEFTSIVSATCHPRNLTGQVSSWMKNLGILLNPPSLSASVSLDSEAPRPQICCQPCPIPKKDLTLTVRGANINTGEYTTQYAIKFDGASLWKQDPDAFPQFQFSCFGGSASLLLPSHPDYQACRLTSYGSDFVCNPYHIRFLLPASCHQYYDDPFFGYREFWIDE